MRKTHPYYGKIMIINVDFPHTMGFFCIFPYCRKLIGKAMHFPHMTHGTSVKSYIIAIYPYGLGFLYDLTNPNKQSPSVKPVFQSLDHVPSS